MRRTSTSSLAVQKSIEKKRNLNFSKNIHINETDATEEHHTQLDKRDSERLIINAESGPLLGLLAMLEKCDNELKFIATNADAFEPAWKEGILDNGKLVKESENSKGNEISSAMIDTEMKSAYNPFHDDVLPRRPVPVIWDESPTYIREVQQQQGDTLFERCGLDGLLLGQGAVESYEILPVTTTNLVEENKVDLVQGIPAGERHINGCENRSIQHWPIGQTDGSFANERDVKHFQALDGALCAQGDLDVAMSNTEQVENDEDIYSLQNDT